MEKEYRDKYADLYRKHWWWRARERALLHTIRQLVPPGKKVRILDIGCGDALFFDALSEFGNVEGIENDASLISATSPYIADIHTVDLADFKPTEKYDLVLLLDVLEHLEAPADFLRQALRLLKNEGTVIVTVPAFPSIWTRHDDLNHHRRRFTRKTLQPVTDSAGMSWQSDRYLFQWAFFAKFLVRILEKAWQQKPKPPAVPARPINAFLYGVTAIEEGLGRVLPLPFGSSLMVIGKKRS